MQIAWYDTADALISLSSTSAIGSVTFLNESMESNYFPLRGQADAPSNAASARVRLLKFGTDVGQTGSRVTWYKPFFAPGKSGVTTYSTWNAGTAPVVGVAQLSDGAATGGPWFAEFRPTSTANAAYGNFRRVCEIVFTPDHDGPAEVTAQVTLTQRSTTYTATQVKFSIVNGGTNVPTGLKAVGNKLSVDPAVVFTETDVPVLYNGGSNIDVPARGNQIGGRTIGLQAGLQYRIAIDLSTDASSNVIQSGSENTLDYASLRITQVKK